MLKLVYFCYHNEINYQVNLRLYMHVVEVKLFTSMHSEQFAKIQTSGFKDCSVILRIVYYTKYKNAHP